MKLARALLLSCALVATLIALPSPASADHCNANQDLNCVGSHGNQDDGTIVTDAMFFPGAEPGSDLDTASAQSQDCVGCEWRLVPACMQNGPEPSGDVLCMGAFAICEARGERGPMFRVYFRPGPGQPWTVVGQYCAGEGGGPVSLAEIGTAVREQVVSELPDAAPSFQPVGGGIVNLPTIFDAGEPATVEIPGIEVLGFDVTVSADASWEWTFDEGITESFAVPGGQYPDDSVSYTYVSSGGRSVSVTSYWDATFTVNGRGPYVVPGGAISKTAGPIAVPVREANSELVGG